MRKADDIHVPNVMKIWEPKPPGNLWATPGLFGYRFTIFPLVTSEIFIDLVKNGKAIQARA